MAPSGPRANTKKGKKKEEKKQTEEENHSGDHARITLRSGGGLPYHHTSRFSSIFLVLMHCTVLLSRRYIVSDRQCWYIGFSFLLL